MSTAQPKDENHSHTGTLRPRRKLASHPTLWLVAPARNLSEYRHLAINKCLAKIAPSELFSAEQRPFAVNGWLLNPVDSISVLVKHADDRIRAGKMAGADGEQHSPRTRQPPFDPAFPIGVSLLQQGIHQLRRVGEILVEGSCDAANVAFRPGVEHLIEFLAHRLRCCNLLILQRFLTSAATPLASFP